MKAGSRSRRKGSSAHRTREGGSSPSIGALLKEAVAREKKGELRDAEHAYRAILSEDPGHPQALQHLARLAKESGHLDTAIALMQRSLARSPSDPACRVNLGNLLRRQGRPEEASASYRAALEIDQAYAPAHFHLGSVSKELGDLAGAQACFRKVLHLAPHDALAWHALGATFMADRRIDAAIECYEKALHLKADYWIAYNDLGVALMAKGELEGAERCHRRAIELNPHHAQSYFNLARSRRFTPADAGDVARMKALLERPDLEQDARSTIHFALGKIHDDLGEIDQAFAHIETANRLRWSPESWDVNRHESDISRLIATFGRAFFAQRKPPRESELPIFIIGLPRSGTTLVEQILASHPNVAGGGELQWLNEIAASLPARTLGHRAYPECTDNIDEELAGSLADEYLARADAIRGTSSRLTDKMTTNFLHLGLIAVMFRNARVVLCRRHPLDIALSLYFQRFKAGFLELSYDLSAIAHYLRQYERLMGHWREVIPLDVQEVDYEELVVEPEAVSRRLIAYCGLPWDDHCLESHKNRRWVHTASDWQIRQPVYPSSVGRWKRYATKLAELMRD